MSFSALSGISLRLKALDLRAVLENALRIDNYEYTAAAGKNSSFLINNFGDPREPGPTFADLSRFDPQPLVQGYWPAIFDGHARGGGNDVAQLAQFAHGIIKNGGNDSTVAVARRSGVALAQTKMRDKMIAIPIQRKLQMHALRVVLATGKAQVLLHGMRPSAVSAGGRLFGHR